MNGTSDWLPQGIIDEFINISHGHLGDHGFTQIKEMVDKYPELVHAVNSQGDETAIGAAAHMGERKIVQFLLEKGAKLDITTAAMMGWRDKVADFLNNDSSQATAKGAHGYALLYFVAQGGDTEMADMVLKHGGGEGLVYPLCPLNSPSIFGAVQFGHVEMTQWFLDHGADLTVQDYAKRTPLERALELGDDELVDILRHHVGLD